MNGDDDTCAWNASREELYQLLVVSEGYHDVSRRDANVLVIASGVSGELQNFSAHVLADGCEVRGSSTANSGLAFSGNHGLEAGDRELETSLGAGTLYNMIFSVILFRAELGDRLRTFRYGMCSEISSKDQTDRSLNITAGNRQFLADFKKFHRLGNDAIGKILHLRINDLHGLINKNNAQKQVRGKEQGLESGNEGLFKVRSKELVLQVHMTHQTR